MIKYIKNKLFPDEKFVPGPTSDGLQLATKDMYIVEDCIVDMFTQKNVEFDEACGITWGAAAIFRRCMFDFAGKLVLVGSGDEDKRPLEENRFVRFEDCWFRNFGRRGPEIQSGTRAEMEGCFIENWGEPFVWDTRAFGVWVHDGGRLKIKNSMFVQLDEQIPFKLWLKDKVGHIGQAIHDHGLKALFQPRTYVNGWRRACTVEDDGELMAENCYKSSRDLVIDNLFGEMSQDEANAKMDWFVGYFTDLRQKLSGRK